MLRIGVAIAQEARATSVHRRELWPEQEQPQPVGVLEIGIDRQRLDFSAADKIVAGVVAELSVCDFKEGLVVAAVHRVAIEISQIVVVRLNRAEHVVPYDLGRHVRIVRVDKRERLSGYIADDRAMILRERNLRRILFSRVLVRRRPIDADGRDDFHRHAVLHSIEHARRNQVPYIVCVLRIDEVARLDARLPRQAPGREGKQCEPSDDDTSEANPHCPQLHSNLRNSPETLVPKLDQKLPDVNFSHPTLLLEWLSKNVNKSNYQLNKYCLLRFKRG